MATQPMYNQPVYPCDQRVSIQSATILDTGTISSAIWAGAFRSGLVKTAHADTYSFLISETKDGTYVALNGVTLAMVAAQWYELPAGVMKAAWFKIVAAPAVTEDEVLSFILKT